MGPKLGRVLLWQFGIAIIIALIAVLIGGRPSGISSFLAGLSCVVPNVIFFVGLFLAQKIFRKIIPATFFVMEFVKIAISIVLMFLVFWLYQDVKWVAFIVSYILVLKSYIFLLSKSKS